jgi:hypothetical protein
LEADRANDGGQYLLVRGGGDRDREAWTGTEAGLGTVSDIGGTEWCGLDVDEKDDAGEYPSSSSLSPPSIPSILSFQSGTI